MARQEFSYKGKQIEIDEDHPHAVIRVDGREFHCHHHHREDDKGLAMWMCDEAYFATPDIKELARHFADYGYMFDDPNRVIVDDEGKVVDKNSKKKTGKGTSGKKSGSGSQGGHGGHGGHGSEGDH
jgi:uncharacterized membrane protein YgcG